MQQFELGNLLKIKQQLQQKISSTDKLKDKITQMSTKLTHQGYQKVNSVMMRNVQIKHTSEFIIKLNDEYFAEVKSHTALQNLQRKKSNYEQQVKKVTSKIQLLQKKIKKAENKQKDNDFLDKYQKSTVQVIGTNQEGDSIFNIIEVEGEEDNDVSEWKNNKKSETGSLGSQKKQQKSLENEQKSKQAAKQTTVQTNEKQTRQQKQPKLQQKQAQEQTGYQIQGDEDILFDKGNGEQSEQSELSEIDQNQDQQENVQKVKQVTQEKKQNGIKKLQSESKKLQKPKSSQEQIVKKNTDKTLPQNANKNAQKQTKEVMKVEQKVKKSQKPVTKTSKQAQVEKKPAIQQAQAAKPISKFKLQRMKQKLQQQL